MKLPGPILEMLSEKAQKDVTTKSGANFLRNDIEAKTGEALSLNTVKRLVGILHYDSEPREITLEIIARYLGYDNWEQIKGVIQNKISEFNVAQGFIDLKELPNGTKVEVKWNPGREILLTHINEDMYEILNANNSKLQKGDHLHLSQIAEGFPFMTKEVIRNGILLGSYTAAKVEGVTSIKVIHG